MGWRDWRRQARALGVSPWSPGPRSPGRLGQRALIRPRGMLLRRGEGRAGSRPAGTPLRAVGRAGGGPGRAGEPGRLPGGSWCLADPQRLVGPEHRACSWHLAEQGPGRAPGPWGTQKAGRAPGLGGLEGSWRRARLGAPRRARRRRTRRRRTRRRRTRTRRRRTRAPRVHRRREPGRRSRARRASRSTLDGGLAGPIRGAGPELSPRAVPTRWGPGTGRRRRNGA